MRSIRDEWAEALFGTQNLVDEQEDLVRKAIAKSWHDVELACEPLHRDIASLSESLNIRNSIIHKANERIVRTELGEWNA